MKHQPLDIYDDMPQGMRQYLQNYGWHFSKKACDEAVKCMVKKDGMPITPWTKEQVNDLLARFNVKLDNDIAYDACYVANMMKADYYGSSIVDEQHATKFIKDYLDDPDGSDELPFRFYCQKMIAVGKPIIWEDIM